MTLDDFIERWICCGRLDDDEVLADLRVVRMNPDSLAEQFIEYTHDPQERHATYRPTTLVITDNGDQVDEVWEVAAADENVGATAPAEDTMVAPALPEGTGKVSPTFLEVDDIIEAGAPYETLAVVGPSSVFRVCQDVIEVPRHRRLPHPHRGAYVAAVVSEIKNRLGCPAPNAANLLAVRRMANNIMGKHGIRPSHTRASIEQIIAGVFVPDESDQRAAEMLASVGMESLREDLHNAGPKSAWYELFHPFKNRGATRVRGTV